MNFITMESLYNLLLSKNNDLVKEYEGGVGDTNVFTIKVDDIEEREKLFNFLIGLGCVVIDDDIDNYKTTPYVDLFLFYGKIGVSYICWGKEETLRENQANSFSLFEELLEDNRLSFDLVRTYAA